MEFITPIFFITQESTIDEIGDRVVVETQRKVLSNKSSVGRAEYYEAQATGLKPELKLEVRSFEYRDELLLILNNVRYNIIRTFNRFEGITELTCSREVNNGGT